VPPSHLEDHPAHHNPTTRTTDRKRELLTNIEHKNEGQHTYGTTYNQQHYKTEENGNIDPTHQHRKHMSNTKKVLSRIHKKNTISAKMRK